MFKDPVLNETYEKFIELKKFIGEQKIKDRIKEIEKTEESPEFWASPEKSQVLLQELSSLKRQLEEIDAIEKKFEYLSELEPLKDEEQAFLLEFEKEKRLLQNEVEELEVKTVLNAPEDRKNAILTIHPGAGGTESQDWAEMLLRMYTRFLDRRNFKYRIVDLQPGDDAGIKDATILVEGEFAYGLLKAERGIHRLVRISPFDASKRRHTSFASVFVYPEREDVEVNISEDELKMDTFRSSGPGGQHMQKNETAVRITHIPTGIVVSCQSERSQHQNKLTALRILKARLYDYLKEQEMEKLGDIEREKSEIAWGRQIRSYILHPYRLVKDHRTDYEETNVEAVLNGEIDEFIRKYLLLKTK
ncbi:MAG TPA: peptide chain release factor 2 [Candidatus Hydrothermia bacterium]|nr:peptide chain release factor 2 [Candidatus Hydrothermae bacterium]MDD3648715.1 peptide chain release factor 2 [Candidatus Hydrothermia bacterium]MDD5573379.1 peptide chain release factor 2 [Candidatus Hydrothermia bacterium]HOP32682.1 peptide chain release factor 2 [Candidatus Hydrothermia bacterium]HRD23053.1 peptide chain release factor 2 [Candidatus Hydrothermia bacterium]